MNKEAMEPARPEPMPVNQPGGFEVVPKIIGEMENFEFPHDGSPELARWLIERSNFGYKKYGARLTYPNGRNWHKDLCDELADAVNYARGALQAGQIGLRMYETIAMVADCVINGKVLPVPKIDE